MLLRRIYYQIVKTYKRLELKCLSYPEADKLIRANEGKPEREQWVIAKEEDMNKSIGMVWLERKERILK